MWQLILPTWEPCLWLFRYCRKISSFIFRHNMLDQMEAGRLSQGTLHLKMSVRVFHFQLSGLSAQGAPLFSWGYPKTVDMAKAEGKTCQKLGLYFWESNCLSSPSGTHHIFGHWSGSCFSLSKFEWWMNGSWDPLFPVKNGGNQLPAWIPFSFWLLGMRRIFTNQLLC